MPINDDVMDASVAHAINLLRASGGISRRMMTILNKVDRDLIEKITLRLAFIEERGTDPGPTTTKRLARLQAVVAEIIRESRDAFQKEVLLDLKDVAVHEVDHQRRLLAGFLPDELGVDIVIPSTSTLTVLASQAQILGKPLDKMTKQWGTAKTSRVQEQITIGVIEGETTAQIVRRIRGTKLRRFKDGILETSRRGAEMIVRTATTNIASLAREALYKENRDIIKGVRWVSTLDDRTSAICQSRDGKIYAIAQGPRPPAHPNCRSTTTPVIRSFKELGINANEISAGTRASVNGQVPADLTYGQWIKRQSVATQNEALGKTKAELFRNGGLKLDKFVDDKGRPLTIPELKATEAKAFKKAGIE